MQSFSKPQKYKAKIIVKNQLTATVYFVSYELLEPKEIDFVAGQTIMITVAPGVYRAMSIASPPQNKTVIDSIQDTAPMGVGSKWLLNRNVGDEVEIMAPLGRFVIDRESPRKRIMVATGTGIAPFRSMILDRKMEPEESGDQKSVSLYWGLRFEEDVYIKQELEKLAGERPNFKFYLTLSKPGGNWPGLKGHVTEHVLANEPDLVGCDFYLCGNKSMIDQMQTELTAAGVARDQMKFDPYY